MIALSRLNMAQNFRLAVRDEFSASFPHGTLLMMAFMKQHTYQRHMHVRHQQLEEISMTLAQCGGNLGKGKEAGGSAIGVEHSVRRDTLEIFTLEVVRKTLVGGRMRIIWTNQKRLVFARAPRGHGAKYNSPIGTAKF